MSQTSPFGGLRPFDIDQANANATLDPYVVRDFVLNNLLHSADQTAARVLVNDMAPDDTYIVDNVDQFSTSPINDADFWRPAAIYGPFVLSVRTVDGIPQPYRLRCAVNGATGTGGTDAFFAIEVTEPSYRAGLWLTSSAIAGPYNALTFASTSSTTPAWLTPSHDLLEVTGDVVYRASRVYGSDDVSGGTPVSVQTISVMVRVLVRGTAAPRLYGCHVAEVL